jgi:hypothetical protein
VRLKHALLPVTRAFEARLVDLSAELLIKTFPVAIPTSSFFLCFFACFFLSFFIPFYQFLLHLGVHSANLPKFAEG